MRNEFGVHRFKGDELTIGAETGIQIPGAEHPPAFQRLEDGMDCLGKDTVRAGTNDFG